MINAKDKGGKIINSLLIFQIDSYFGTSIFSIYETIKEWRSIKQALINSFFIFVDCIWKIYSFCILLKRVTITMLQNCIWFFFKIRSTIIRAFFCQKKSNKKKRAAKKINTYSIGKMRITTNRIWLLKITIIERVIKDFKIRRSKNKNKYRIAKPKITN